MLHFLPSHLRLDSLFFGVLISYFYYYRPQSVLFSAKRFRWLLVAVAVLAFAPPFIWSILTTPNISTFGYTVIYLGGGALLLMALVAKPPSVHSLRAIPYIGSHSYSIYLWHLPVLKAVSWGLPRLFPSAGEPNWFLLVISYFLITILFGILLALLIEFPVLKLRDRLFPSRSV